MLLNFSQTQPQPGGRFNKKFTLYVKERKCLNEMAHWSHKNSQTQIPWNYVHPKETALR